MMIRWLPLSLVLSPLLVAAEPVGPEPPSPDDEVEPTEPEDEADEVEPTEPEDEARGADAQPEPEPPAADEPTAADVEGAPPPGQESGRVDPRDRGEGPLRWLGRGLLLVPYTVVQILAAPIRLSLWAYDRYHLYPVARTILFDDTLTYGVYPVVGIESLYGLNIAGRFVHRDLFGAREHLSLEVGTGGRFSSLYSGRLRSGERFGERVGLELAGSVENRPQEIFYGIGDDGDRARPRGAFTRMVEGDPVETRFSERVAQVSLSGHVLVTDALALHLTGALADFEFGSSDEGISIETVYPVETLVGFDGYRQAYLELEARWDTRRAAGPWEISSLRAAGSLVSGFAGRVFGLEDSESYWRVGMDLQHIVPIGRGPRMIIARLYAETVSGDIDEVPFNQLPRLGGATLLRGFAVDRFRDRVAATGSLEYSWDLARRLWASTFVDAGSVFPALDELDEGNLRVGFGGSLGFNTERSFVLRATLAGSTDGAFFFLSFDHVLDLSPRVERR